MNDGKNTRVRESELAALRTSERDLGRERRKWLLKLVRTVLGWLMLSLVLISGGCEIARDLARIYQR